MRTSIGASVMTVVVLASALGAAAPARAIDLRECQDVTPVTSQKKCIDANTKVIAKAIIGVVYKRCKNEASAGGDIGSATELMAMICTEGRLLELYEGAGG